MKTSAAKLALAAFSVIVCLIAAQAQNAGDPLKRGFQNPPKAPGRACGGTG